MCTILGTVITAIATAVAGLICAKVSKVKQRRDAEADVEKARKKLEEEKKEMSKAIFEKDDAKVNAAVARFLAGCLLGIIAVGCVSGKTEIKYVSSDRRIVSMTNEYGVACKAVPDVVFAEIMEKMMELEAIKKEKDVDKRMGAQ